MHLSDSLQLIIHRSNIIPLETRNMRFEYTKREMKGIVSYYLDEVRLVIWTIRATRSQSSKLSEFIKKLKIIYVISTPCFGKVSYWCWYVCDVYDMVCEWCVSGVRVVCGDGVRSVEMVWVVWRWCVCGVWVVCE